MSLKFKTSYVKTKSNKSEETHSLRHPALLIQERIFFAVYKRNWQLTFVHQKLLHIPILKFQRFTNPDMHSDISWNSQESFCPFQSSELLKQLYDSCFQFCYIYLEHNFFSSLPSRRFSIKTIFINRLNRLDQNCPIPL